MKLLPVTVNCITLLAVDVIIVVGFEDGPEPIKVRDFPTFNASVYVPAPIWIISPSRAALIAAWIVE